MERPSVLILGKLPPPHIGPAVATEIILQSELRQWFNLLHFDTKINDSVGDMGMLRPSKIGKIRFMYRAFRQMLLREKPQLVLVPIGQTSAGFFKDVPLIRMAARSGARVLIHLRGSEWRTWYDGLDFIRSQWVRSAISKAHGAIVLGDNLQHIFKGFFPQGRIYTVPNGGDFSFPERKDHQLRLLYLANYLPGKGLLEVLKALEIVFRKEGIPPFVFEAYGSWNDAAYKSACENLASRLPSCRLNGPVSGPDKWQAFADADVFIFAPTAPEGHPWSIVEASAAGLPIISTKRGAIALNVVHGINGFLYENPDPTELADGIAQLIAGESLRARMSKASRTLHKEKFTAEKMVAALRDVFNDALKYNDMTGL